MALEGDQFDHPAWLAGLGTVVGYGLILALLTVLLFLVPYAIFMA
ncbi:hypothetical protein [Halovivax limisalsi]|nr:hypothetical protein [Halovivax limisalsi]